MSFRTRACILLLLPTIGLAACSSSDDSAKSAADAPTSTSAAPSSSSTTAAAAKTSTTAAGASITVKDFTFEPVTVPAGATVRLLNSDVPTTHTVESRDGLWTFDANTETFTAPTTAGAYAIFCGVHASMTGTLTVT